MKLLTDAKWRVDLSPAAEKKLDAWLKENEYGATIDGEFIPDPQLSIGQLIHFLDDNETVWDIQKKDVLPSGFWRVGVGEKLIEDDNLCDALASAVREILEQKN